MDANTQTKFMGPIEALTGASKRVWRLWRVLAMFYISNVGMAALMVAPIAALLMSRLGHSLESDRLFAQFDFSWAIETLRADSLVIDLLKPVFLCVAAAYLLLSTFLSGGALAVIFRRRRSFFGEGARALPRFLRLLLWSLPAYGLVLLFNSLLAKLFAKLAEDSMQAHTWVMISWARVLLVLFLLGMVNLVFDWAKILLIVEHRAGAFWAAVDGVRFVLYSPRTSLGVFFLGQLFGLLFLLIYHGLTQVMPQTTFSMLLLTFVLRQVYTLARMWLRLLVWDADALYYRSLVPEAREYFKLAGPEAYASLSSTIVAPVPPSEGEAG